MDESVAADDDLDALDPDEGPLDPLDAHFETVDARIETLCDTTLKERIAALEQDRLKVKRAIARGVVAIAVPIVAFFFSDEIGGLLEALDGGSPVVRWLHDYLTVVIVGLFLLSIAYIGVVLAMPALAVYMNYRQRFKQEVVAEICKTVIPTGTYQPDHHITQSVFDTSGIWSGGYERFQGDDLIRGRVGATEFEASELDVHHHVTIQRRRKREPITRRPNVTIFNGLFFHLGLDRTLRGHTIVEPEAAEGRMPGHRSGFEQIALDDEAFTGYFRVYTTDRAEAAELLNARVRERMVRLTDHLANAPFVAFVGNHFFVAIHSGLPLLEPTIARPASYATLSKVGEYFALPELLARDVMPTAAAFGAAPAPDILSTAPAAGFAAKALRSGDTFGATGHAGHVFGTGHAGHVFGASARPADRSITTDDLAGLVMQPADERDLALRPAPASHVRVSSLTGEGLTVSYPLTPGFYVRVIWTLALTPFVAAGAARLAGERGAALLDAIVTQLPLAAMAADQASRWPVTFCILAFLFHLWPAYVLVMAPSGLHITREGVRVSRRLWPVATVYAHDRIAAVKVTDKQVALQRKNASLLRRYVFPAPLMPTGEDARWLAAQLRRAMLMFGGLRGH